MVAMGTEPELSIALLSERTAEKKPMVSPELQLPRPVIKVKLAPFITGSFRQWSEQNAQTAPTSTMSVPPHHIGPQQLFEIAASL
jgi:hypothetical protein